MKPVSSIRVGEPFLLLCDIKNETPYAIRFRDSRLELESNLKFKTSISSQQDRVESLIKNETLKNNETATECFCLVINENELDSKKKLNLGDYLIEWRRSTSEEDEENESDCELNDKLCVLTRIRLPDVSVEVFPFLIETSMPSYGKLDEQIVISYRIKNKTQANVLDLECNLTENEYFSIAGNKLVILNINFFKSKLELKSF